MKTATATLVSFIIAACLCGPGNVLSAQQSGRPDKYTLLTMPYNLRQLTLYKGQVTLNAGYKFSVRSRMYGADGNLVYLKNSGTGSVYHYYFADFRYGVTDFFTVGAETNYIRRGVREESVTYASNILATSDRISVNKLTEFRGLGDILLTGSLRLPFQYRWFDIAVTGGIFVPSSEYKPELPKNSVTNVTTASSYTVNYHYNYTNGYGVPVWLVSAAAKIRIARFTLAADYQFKTPKEEGTNIRFDETLTTDKVFSYKELSYSYLLSNTHMVNASLHYQPTGWFDANLNVNWFRSAGGWTEYWGVRYRNPEKRLVALEPGLELQVSPSIIIYQVAGFPVSGKNSDAPFYLFTTVRYSFFPFHRQ